MGTWGTGLFSDDTANDVRDEYRELVGEGLEGPAATDKLLDSWQSQLTDPDVAPVFWLALADTQWKVGRLEDRVRQAALKVIEDGSDLRRWEEDSRLQAKRASVLQKLQLQLQSPQPAPKRLPKVFRDSCDWAVGEVVGLRLRSGKLALLRVVAHHADRGGVSPICEVLDCATASLPDPKIIARARPRSFVGPWANSGDGTILLGATSAREKPFERIVRTGIVSRSRRPQTQPVVVLWRHVDERLSEFFGLES